MRIKIDGIEYEVDPNQNLLQNSVKLGLNLPYFCWHPKLGSIGACRQCAVQHFKDDQDKVGRTVMACMTAPGQGQCFSIQHEIAQNFRKSVIEWLMTSHPHDCPVCDEGGECHLQDMTLMSKHNVRRYDFKKRTHKNQNLGPYIRHEMNRCIACYRCVRFYNDYAGGDDLAVFSSANKLYFGRHQDGPFESAFSGNLVEVCPTGVFTDKMFHKQYVRKWDLQSAPSICHGCSLGCNISPGAKSQKLRRIQNRFHPDVNGYFICDKGRFDYSFNQDENRQLEIKGEPQIKLEQGKKLMGLGSPNTSLENNFALMLKVGKENFCTGLNQKEIEILDQVSKAKTKKELNIASLKEVEEADCVIVLGEDLLKTSPMLHLACMQAKLKKPRMAAMKQGIPAWNAAAIKNSVQNSTGPIFYLHKDFNLADCSKIVLGLKEPESQLESPIKAIVNALIEAESPVIIAGMNSIQEETIKTFLEISKLLSKSKSYFTLKNANDMGVYLLGGLSLEAFENKLKNYKPDLVINVENTFDKNLSLDRIQTLSKELIHLSFQKNNDFHHQIPTATFFESTGTVLSSEGRAQRHFQVYSRGLHAAWHSLFEGSFDDLWNLISGQIPILDGVHLALNPPEGFKIPTMTPRASTRTAIHTHISMHEGIPEQDEDSVFSHTMEGPPSHLLPSSCVSSKYSAGYNSISANQKFNIFSSGLKIFDQDKKEF